MSKRLGIGFIGSGFMTRFHVQSWIAVRDADIRGFWSPNAANAASAAALARDLRVGDARAFASIEDMVAAPEIDCIWICGPNHARVDNMEAIVAALRSGKGRLVGVACEKPLARNVAEARRMVALVEESGLLHGYLEDQLFQPTVRRAKDIAWKRGAALTGRPFLARAAEEHSGPHAAWFWDGVRQGGGVLNDMMCHSIEVGRFLLTAPGARRDSIRPVEVSAQIASLKWSQPGYARQLQEAYGVDFTRNPSEDFARATVRYVDEAGRPLIVETTTSWAYTGAGLRLSAELLGPEYSVSVNSLDTPARLFFSRRVSGAAGEDMVEKQNAEQGLMPLVGNEAAEYGYEAENRYFTSCFLAGVQPEENFHAGLEVTELLMTAYMSAEQGRVLAYRPEGLDAFVPAVARAATDA
ncbi:Gfo/Idh/MocA family oxidoreductase [Opitutales bacterium ASA1]|uniref:Gfo/Idh/MocA family protein n=1 Tax=Congregicoccus parvus TaxID=3081749 RepID=UPI002B3248E1|nr:Gfo/Idh/MocA family oxidoreductase [Opitutales bacterium ASA1]